MPTLDQPTTNHPGTHLLLIGATKTGKTRYLAGMAIDGFYIVYVDNDNGYGTLMALLKDHPEAQKRVFYIATQNIWEFCSHFFGRTVFSWNLEQDIPFAKGTAKPDDVILTMRKADIPKGVVLAFDSWTSISIRLLEKAAKATGITIEDFREGGQDAFGSANRSANQMLMNIQGYPHTVVMQAHPDNYEIRVSPPGQAKDVTKQANQIIKANWEVPYSVSRPHGFSMGKFFSDIGWMGIDPVGKFTLDFRQQKDRVSGGSPQKIGDPTTELRFSKAFHEPVDIGGFGWIEEVPASEIIAKMEESKAAPAANATAAPNPRSYIKK